MNNNQLREIVLSLEDDPEIISFKFDDYDMNIWPLVRWNILSEIMNSLVAVETVNHNKLNKSNYKLTLSYLYHTILGNPFFTKNNVDIIFINSDIYNVVLNKGQYMNRLYDYFGMLYPDITLSIEKSYNLNYRKPRFFKRVKHLDALIIYAKILSIVKNLGKKRLKDKGVEKFQRFLENKLSNSKIPKKYIKEIKENIDRTMSRIENEKVYLGIFGNLVERFLNKFKPKIVFLDDASYGHRNAIIIRKCKQKGVPIAEFQHGITNKKDIPYNYHENIILSGLYNIFLPDYYLTFGSFWEDVISMPVQIIPIGSPQLTERKKLLLSKFFSKDIKFDFLIISQWTVTKELVKLAEELSILVGANKKICFRLHPVEVSRKETYESLFKLSNIEVDYQSDLYELIIRSKNIVGFASTALWEALEFKDRVFLYRYSQEANLFLDDMMGVVFENAEQLIELSNIKDLVVNKKQDIWLSNWQENFRSFIKFIYRNEGKLYNDKLYNKSKQ